MNIYFQDKNMDLEIMEIERKDKMISYYELLTRIKEGDIPFNVKYKGATYYADYDLVSKEFTGYYIVNERQVNETTRLMLSECFLESDMFSPEIEVIQEYKPFEDKIKKIDFRTLNTQKEKNRVMKDTINKIIDKLEEII